jgi:hypothetical protein
MNPYKTIWLNPSDTFDFYAKEDEIRPLFFIPILVMGLSMGLDQAPDISKVLESEFTWWSLAISVPVSVGMSFLILAGLMPWLLRKVGRIWNASSTNRQMTNIISISTIPYSCIVIYQFLKLLIEQNPAIENINSGLNFILYTWTFGLLILGVSKVQKLSYGLAILNIILAYLPLFILGILRG